MKLCLRHQVGHGMGVDGEGVAIFFTLPDVHWDGDLAQFETQFSLLLNIRYSFTPASGPCLRASAIDLMNIGPNTSNKSRSCADTWRLMKYCVDIARDRFVVPLQRHSLSLFSEQLLSRTVG